MAPVRDFCPIDAVKALRLLRTVEYAAAGDGMTVERRRTVIEYIAFDAHKRYTQVSVETADGERRYEGPFSLIKLATEKRRRCELVPVSARKCRNRRMNCCEFNSESRVSAQAQVSRPRVKQLWRALMQMDREIVNLWPFTILPALP